MLTRISVIPAGQSVGDGVLLSMSRIVGVTMPAAWDPATLGFDVSHDGAVWYPMRDGVTNMVTQELAYDAPVGSYFGVDINLFVGPKFIRVRSGIFGATIPQTAPRQIILSYLPLLA
jgi:hypothetical protein